LGSNIDNEEYNDIWSWAFIIGMTESRLMRWTGHAVGTV